MLRGVGIEPTRISPADLKPAALTTRPSSFFGSQPAYVYVLVSLYIVCITTSWRSPSLQLSSWEVRPPQ